MQNNRSTFAILFYLNTSKKKKSGNCPVMGRISVDGKSSAFSTGLELSPEKWDAKQGIAIGKSKEETTINKRIENNHKKRKKEKQCNSYDTRRKKWCHIMFSQPAPALFLRRSPFFLFRELKLL